MDRTICVQSAWELRTADGELLDRSDRDNNARETPFHFHRIIGREVVGHAMGPPEWIELEMDNGVRIRIYDDSDQYESFSIHPENLYV